MGLGEALGQGTGEGGRRAGRGKWGWRGGCQDALLPKDGVELLGDVVLLVPDVSLAQPDGDVGVSFAIDVGGVQVCGLGREGCS